MTYLPAYRKEGVSDVGIRELRPFTELMYNKCATQDIFLFELLVSTHESVQPIGMGAGPGSRSWSPHQPAGYMIMGLNPGTVTRNKESELQNVFGVQCWSLSSD